MLYFKDIYWAHFENKVVQQPCKVRWERIIGNYHLEWGEIWGNVHDNLLPFHGQSALWKMTNLNYICVYSLNKMYNSVNSCRLCNNLEEGPAHVFLFCEVSSLVYNFLNQY